MKQTILKTQLIRLGLVALTSAFLFSIGSCDKTESKTSIQKCEIKISPKIQNLTKATDVTFQDEDEIGLTVVKWYDENAVDLTGSRVENNVKFTYDGGVFLPDAAAYFPDETSKTTFFATYPYNTLGFNYGENVMNITLSNKQNSAAKYTKCDYMYAIAEGITPTEEKVTMEFKHILSKIVVKLVAGDGYTDAELSKAKVELRRFNTSASYDVKTSVFSNFSKIDNIYMYNKSSIASAVVIPQTINSGDNLIYITIGDTVFAYEADKEYKFETGRINEFTATISKASSTVQKISRTMMCQWN